MNPLVGWALAGPVVRPPPANGARGRLGEPSWSPSQLLRDLELRLGLPQLTPSAAQRVPAYAQRLLALPGAFYARSLAADSLGTAATLLAWRDALLDAGWNGLPIPGGGDRLDALAALESNDPLPPGDSDRLVRVENELRACSKHAIYESLTLVEPRALWSVRWQRVLTLLEERKARIAQLTTDLPGAPAGSDLGVLQQMLRGERPSCRGGDPPAIRGDGTLLLLRGDTSGDLAELTAAFLSAHREGAIVVRGSDHASLEAALPRHGLPHQGHAPASAWRPAMQILPLALELAYAPRDPYRVLELLTLPVGPFRGVYGTYLARAVAKQPGVGGGEWLRQKDKAEARAHELHVLRRIAEGATPLRATTLADAHLAERRQRLAEWIEAAGAPESGAAREALLAVATRVRTFLHRRLGRDDLRAIYAAAHDQAKDLEGALARDHRATLSREDMRHLLDSVVRSAQALDLTVERAGRIDHVDHPAALLASALSVVFWGFVSGTERRASLQQTPWNRAELTALEHAGVRFPDAGELLAVESRAWRQGILAARERVVFVVPATVKGSSCAPHPTWDEIAARLGLRTEQALALVTRTPHALLAGRGEALVPVLVAPVPALLLPAARHTWTLPAGRIAAEQTLQSSPSPTALGALASCPLRFVLSHHARLRGGALARVANGPLLNGSLGHRLVELLFREGAFDLEETAFDARAGAVLEALLATEGATLLLGGAGFERMQLVPQLVRAMRALRQYLVDTGWRIAGVEEAVTTTSTLGILKGRLDVRLVSSTHAGKEAVLDLKWGDSHYRTLLEEGRAVQLAAYVQGRSELGGKTSIPPAAYFSLSNARVLTADGRMGMDKKTLEGATLAETWSRVERTAKAVQGALRAGTVHVAATKHAPPLLDALGIPETQHAEHYALPKATDACDYCDYAAICGKAWEAVR